MRPDPEDQHLGQLPTARGAALAGALGGGAVGLAEAVRLGIGVAPDGVGLLVVLVALDIAFGALLGGAAALGLRAIGVVRRPGTAALIGALAFGWISLAIAWFTDPPPFQEPFPLQGDPLGFLAVGVLLPALLLAGLLRGADRVRGGRTALIALPLAGLAGWAGAPLLAADGGAGAPATAPNLLLVTLDTIRADRFGDHPIDTSAFDRVAAEGVRFHRAMAQIPVTGPSHATMMNGVPPWSSGMLLNGTPLPEEHPLLAEILREQGYATGAFVSAYVLHGNLGFDRGFGVYDDDFGAVPGLSEALPGRLFAMARRRIDRDHLLERPAEATVDRALSWLDDQEGPFFAWVHLFDPHGPYAPPPPWDERYYGGSDPRDPNNRSMDQVDRVAPYLKASLEGITDVRYVIARYDGEVAYADSQVGRLLAWLDDTGRAADTLVVIAGDHGEGLGEHGEWFDHGDFLYDHDLHVPLAMRFPDRLPASRIVPHPVELTDLTPTLLELLGAPGLEDGEGRSLVPAITSAEIPRTVARSVTFDREANRAARAEDPSFPPTFRMVSVRAPGGRYVLREAEGQEDEFLPEDLLTDPDEQARLRELLREAARTMLEGAGSGAVRLVGEGDREMLEALGYVDGD